MTHLQNLEWQNINVSPLKWEWQSWAWMTVWRESAGQETQRRRHSRSPSAEPKKQDFNIWTNALIMVLLRQWLCSDNGFTLIMVLLWQWLCSQNGFALIMALLWQVSYTSSNALPPNSLFFRKLKIRTVLMLYWSPKHVKPHRRKFAFPDTYLHQNTTVHCLKLYQLLSSSRVGAGFSRRWRLKCTTTRVRRSGCCSWRCIRLTNGCLW